MSFLKFLDVNHKVNFHTGCPNFTLAHSGSPSTLFLVVPVCSGKTRNHFGFLYLHVFPAEVKYFITVLTGHLSVSSCELCKHGFAPRSSNTVGEDTLMTSTCWHIFVKKSIMVFN